MFRGIRGRHECGSADHATAKDVYSEEDVDLRSLVPAHAGGQ